MSYDYTSLDFHARLAGELDGFKAVLDGDVDLAAPVRSCGDWSVYDLVEHMGKGNFWAVSAVAELRGDAALESAPADPAGLREWFGRSCEAIVASLAQDPETEAWTFSRNVPQTVGFWRRRRAHETAVHLWDLRAALGITEPVPLDLALDGVTEIFDLFAPRMIDRGLAAAPSSAVRITATDAPASAVGSWVYGPGEPVAELSGEASDLLLALWGRASSGDKGFTWSGDRAAGEAVLAGPLVP